MKIKTNKKTSMTRNIKMEQKYPSQNNKTKENSESVLYWPTPPGHVSCREVCLTNPGTFHWRKLSFLFSSGTNRNSFVVGAGFYVHLPLSVLGFEPVQALCLLPCVYQSRLERYETGFPIAQAGLPIAQADLPR